MNRRLHPQQVDFEEVGKRERIDKEGRFGARDEVETGTKRWRRR
jgi:hypothetical protein